MSSDPSWLTVARKYIGVREVKGPKHSPTIMGWLKRLKSWIKDDETPWCGVFVANCLDEAGLPIDDIYPRAKSWADYGSNLRFSHLAPGAILVFVREGGGHVGFYVGEDSACFHVLGGNQGDSVSITRIAKSRCISARWPKGVPVTGGPVRLEPNGSVSKNEA